MAVILPLCYVGCHCLIRYNQQLQSIKDNYKTFDLPYNGVDNTDYVNGEGFSSDDDTPEAAQARGMVKTRAGEAGTNERMQFYYHPDHLGSSSYITNLDGEVMQHIEYVPFGEVFIEERNNTWNTPYLFNAKELDEETGMYYYGARYYEPRLSLWMSCDPKQEKYPNVNSYCYANNNPIIFIDTNGKEGIVVSGQHGGTMQNREHFLINGLDRAKRALSHRHSKKEAVTWIVFSESDTDYGYTKKELEKYKQQAQKNGINMIVVDDADDIVKYINNKNGGKSRENDKISSFYYVGHATPGDLNVGYNGGWLFDGDEFDADQLNSDAFSKGTWVNVTAACRTAVSGYIEESIVEQFSKKLDSTSKVFGSDVRTFFGGGVRSDSQLLEKNKGHQVKQNGKK